MNTQDVTRELIAQGANMRNIRIREVEADAYDVCCLVGINGLWESYYWEGRGKQQLMTFTSEDEACDYFLAWVSKSFAQN
ncbi:MAG: hypothetical protein FD124_2491 [Alphaproteobacteria bacterium]|nr:MAG: hypothetical protein FD124_2491 [Alphaproteobacteria bacterium]